METTNAKTNVNTNNMTYTIMCSWADSCAQSYSDPRKFTTAASLVDDIEKFLESECGMDSVEFYRVDFENSDGAEILPFEWENSDLKRSQTLSDVWHKEVKDLTKHANEIVNGNNKQ